STRARDGQRPGRNPPRGTSSGALANPLGGAGKVPPAGGVHQRERRSGGARMNRYLTPSQTRSPKVAKATLAALAGFAIAALVGVALAATFTLQVAKNAKVTNQARTTVSENIVVTSRGFAVYSLS